MTIVSSPAFTSVLMCDSNDNDSLLPPPALRSQLSTDLASAGGTHADDLSVSRDIFDFDEFFLQPAAKLLEDDAPQGLLPRRSVSFVDTTRAASHSMGAPEGMLPTSLSTANFRFGRSQTTPLAQGSSSNANARFGLPHNTTASQGHGKPWQGMTAPSSSMTPSTTTMSANPFSRSMSVRNVSDLKRTRDKMLRAGIGGGSSAHTPLYALKNLARQRAADAALRGQSSSVAAPSNHHQHNPPRMQVASLLNLPSNALLDAVRNRNGKRLENPSSLSSSSSSTSVGGTVGLASLFRTASSAEAPPSKRIRPTESSLHRACCRPGVTPMEIYQLLQRDPGAASRSERLQTSKAVYDHGLQRRVEKLVNEPYTLPLNLAIAHRQSNQVLDMLMNVAPAVLTMRDGPEREGPLSILLKCSPQDTDTVDRMLLLSPKCVALRDKRGNTPAHIACTRTAALDAVRHICIMYPESLRMRNSHGHTPLRLAELYTRTCSEEVCAFLWDQQQQLLRNGTGDGASAKY